MNQQQLTPAERAERSAEQAVLIAGAVIAATRGYAAVARRRWPRGNTMAGPAKIYLVSWTVLALTWFSFVLVAGASPAARTDNALTIAWIGLGIWVAVGTLTWVAWIIALALWEAMVWFGHTDAQLTGNRRGRWLNLADCQANKAHLEAGLRSLAPNLAISGLIAAAGDGGGLLGTDLAIASTSFVEPWQAWNHAEARLAAGQQVWFDNPPPVGQTMRVVRPYVKLGLWTAGMALWIGSILDLPGNDPITVTILLALVVVALGRHRIRAAIIAAR
jgi:hypothetical protein